MSDSKSSYGEPVEEPRAVDDVVGSAHEGIADAEAAAATPSEPMVEDDPAFDSAMYEAHADDATTASPVATAAAAPVVTSSEPVAQTPVAETTVIEPAVVAPAAVAGAAYATPQPIFVQAPESPRPRGNRAAAGAIGLLAALSFAVLYLAVWVGIGLLNGEVATDAIATTVLAALGTWSLWVPVAVFFIAFWLLGAIINRGRWGSWVIFGLLVGVAAYFGHILGALCQAPFWMLTASQGAELVEAELLSPLAIAAFVIGRELTIWFGAWVARRGARVTELNVEAQREYERTLEAGPQLTRV